MIQKMKKMLNKMVERADSIAIAGHIRPDGDCVGSSMGLYQYLKEQYPTKEINVYLEEVPNVYKFIDATREICHEIEGEPVYDLFIALDCGDKERLGFAAELFDNAGHTFCIDHHISNQEFADDNYIIPDASSTSELVYNLIDKEKMSLGIAQALFLGIVHDTGAFQYSCASPETFEAAAQLLRTGVNGTKIIKETFFEKSYAQHQILGHALIESVLLLEGKYIASHMMKKEMDFYGVKAKDLDGIVSQLHLTKGVEVSVFMYELESGVFKVSLRSADNVDVSRIAQHFGGGGHIKAAGFSMEGVVTNIMDQILEQIKEQL